MQWRVSNLFVKNVWWRTELWQMMIPEYNVCCTRSDIQTNLTLSPICNTIFQINGIRPFDTDRLMWCLCIDFHDASSHIRSKQTKRQLQCQKNLSENTWQLTLTPLAQIYQLHQWISLLEGSHLTEYFLSLAKEFSSRDRKKSESRSVWQITERNLF